MIPHNGMRRRIAHAALSHFVAQNLLRCFSEIDDIVRQLAKFFFALLAVEFR
jgi:hypothetical protein